MIGDPHINPTNEHDNGTDIKWYAYGNPSNYCPDCAANRPICVNQPVNDGCTPNPEFLVDLSTEDRSTHPCKATTYSYFRDEARPDPIPYLITYTGLTGHTPYENLTPETTPHDLPQIETPRTSATTPSDDKDYSLASEFDRKKPAKKRSLNTETIPGQEANIWPTIVKAGHQLKYELKSNSKAINVHITGIDGQQVSQQKVTKEKGKLAIPNQCKKGVYIVKFESKKGHILQRSKILVH